MTSISLRTLTVEHLRGSVRPFSLPFEKGKKLTVVYGENGTGKTTICDALEFLGSGKVGSLENRGLGKTNRYWPSVGKSAADVTVTLEADNGTCSARIQKADVVVLPPESRPTVEVLRRSQILSLVQAKPGDRYEAIRRFIDVRGGGIRGRLARIDQEPEEEPRPGGRQGPREPGRHRSVLGNRRKAGTRPACLGGTGSGARHHRNPGRTAGVE